jgi:DNA-binding response OmpR family regulator
MNILIIEDDKLLTRALTYRLQKANHIVQVTNNGNSAYTSLSEYPADLIICDLNIPGISGQTFLQLLRNFLCIGTPVIVISAMEEGEELLKGANIAYDFFIRKPLDFDELMDKIQLFD